ncbi:hypothetical protein [uncultured Clostridium sp.]|uniref:hypothetical protein n=1 Tax=uncultured Clostridium sp. TaxID=59620 RepID=UPI0028EE666B|nr:hypothetical protein [uncultured Clostridium sp.]
MLNDEKEKVKKKLFKIIAIVSIILICIFTLFASIGVSVLTGDYNYFIFTVLGMTIAIFLSCITLISLLISKKKGDDTVKKVFLGFCSAIAGIMMLGESLFSMGDFILNKTSYNIAILILNIVITIIFGVITFKCLNRKSFNKLKGEEMVILFVGMLEIVKSLIGVSYMLPSQDNIIANRNEILITYLAILFIQNILFWKRESITKVFKDMENAEKLDL